MASFGEWLDDELDKRGWYPSILANKAGIDSGNLSRYLSGERNINADTAIRIAKALELPPETVFRQAGLLPPVRDPEDLTFKELYEIAKQLSPERRAELVELALFYLRRDRNKPSPGSHKNNPADVS